MKPLHRNTFALALTAWLAACGPGSGGTGTGETGAAFVVFNATSASLCDTKLPDALPCVGGVLSITSTPDVLASSVAHFSNVAQGGNLTLTIQGDSVELVDPCRKLRFTGDWGITADGDARFFGSYTQDSMAPVISSVAVLPTSSANANELSVVVRDATGRVVLGPVSLQQVAAPFGATPACS